MPVGGHFLYETMWNSEWKHKTLGHFREYIFDNNHTVGHPTKGAVGVFHPAFQAALKTRGIIRVDGKTSLGHNGLKWGFRGGPKVYKKTV